MEVRKFPVYIPDKFFFIVLTVFSLSIQTSILIDNVKAAGSYIKKNGFLIYY